MSKAVPATKPVIVFRRPDDEEGRKRHHETRLRAEWKKCAREEGVIEKIEDTFYFYGSEVATLRLLKYFRHVDLADQGFSENLKTYYFRLTPTCHL